MEKFIGFLLNKKLIIYLFTFLLVLAGVGSLLTFNRELVPTTNLPWIEVNISGGSLPPEEMEEKSTKPIEKELKSVPDIEEFTSNSSTGSVEISVQVSEGKGAEVKQEVQTIVNRLRSSFPRDVVEQLQAANVKQSIGTLKNTGFDTVVEVDRSFKTIQQIGDVTVQTPSGRVYLRQLASVEDMRGKSSDAVYMKDGRPYIMLEVKRSSSGDVITTAAAVQQVIDRINREARGSYNISVVQDGASFIKHAVNNLSRDVAIGGVLAIVIRGSGTGPASPGQNSAAGPGPVCRGAAAFPPGKNRYGTHGGRVLCTGQTDHA
ncbi:acriflavin resistance protein [Desulfocucumis palustris]|uniref:Acriflavin resistance protein n=1 Tax=Desulfocucumis palustris TaxID=1898651 RepID=A0A2L2XC44_9FIRM|nr:efflux RND transporter permease subunit [Desulfocucumis palustris]GBF33899.1 acriflavin resistance protein [Desulfocucumis palustris]